MSVGLYPRQMEGHRGKGVEFVPSGPISSEIFTLFYLGEKSIREIKEITSLSVSNIKVILHRSRKKMTKNLEKLNYERVG